MPSCPGSVTRDHSQFNWRAKTENKQKKADNWRAGSREGGQLAGRVQGRRTTGGQGPGKADNWRAGSREGGQLAGRVQGRRTTGGQGPGNADNWQAGSREGGQLVGQNRRQHKNRRTTGGEGGGKADNWRAGYREGGQLAGRVTKIHKGSPRLTRPPPEPPVQYIRKSRANKSQSALRQPGYTLSKSPGQCKTSIVSSTSSLCLSHAVQHSHNFLFTPHLCSLFVPGVRSQETGMIWYDMV